MTATFIGKGIVKWKDRVLVNFEEHNGRFTTSDERVIQRLELLGFERKDQPVTPQNKPTEAPKAPGETQAPIETAGTEQNLQTSQEAQNPEPEKQAGKTKRKGGRTK